MTSSCPKYFKDSPLSSINIWIWFPTHGLWGRCSKCVLQWRVKGRGTKTVQPRELAQLLQVTLESELPIDFLP